MMCKLQNLQAMPKHIRLTSKERWKIKLTTFGTQLDHFSKRLYNMVKSHSLLLTGNDPRNTSEALAHVHHHLHLVMVHEQLQYFFSSSGNVFGINTLLHLK